METFLSSSIPNLIPQNTILQAAFLSEESGTDGWFFIWLEFIRDLKDRNHRISYKSRFSTTRRTKRRTTEDFPTAASPITDQG